MITQEAGGLLYTIRFLFLSVSFPRNGLDELTPANNTIQQQQSVAVAVDLLTIESEYWVMFSQHAS